MYVIRTSHTDIEFVSFLGFSKCGHFQVSYLFGIRYLGYRYFLLVSVAGVVVVVAQVNVASL